MFRRVGPSTEYKSGAYRESKDTTRTAFLITDLLGQRLEPDNLMTALFCNGFLGQSWAPYRRERNGTDIQRDFENETNRIMDPAIEIKLDRRSLLHGHWGRHGRGCKWGFLRRRRQTCLWRSLGLWLGCLTGRWNRRRRPW